MRFPMVMAEMLSTPQPASDRFSQTLATVAAQTRSGGDFRPAVREFLDEFGLRRDPDSRLAAIASEPVLIGEPRFDAFLGALAEHLAAEHSLPRPPWSIAEGRFLDRFWFVSETPGFRALALAQAPAAFRRRGVFIPARSLVRV